MPVNTTHPEYDKRYPQWHRCRDTIEGTDAIKEAGTEYLPQLTAQDTTEYASYKKRALFYGASNRTVQGLLGAVFRKDFTYTYPLKEHIDVFTIDGLDLWESSRVAVKEILTTGRYGVLIDTDETYGRAFAAPYIAENIVNWRSRLVAGKVNLVLVVLREQYPVPDDDNDLFTAKVKTQYRVLRLIPNGTTFIYIQEIWRQLDNDKSTWSRVEVITPKRRGVPLDHIPFVFFNTHQGTPNPEKPPLLDLVDVNLSHYRTSADMEHGAHYTALPTAWIAGFDADKQFKIGSQIAWVSDKTDAKAGFLEFRGQGLGALRELKKDKEHLMAILGARLLEDQRRAAEAADTYRIRQSGEGGALSAIVRTTSDGMRRVMREMATWSDIQGTDLEAVEYQLNNDFIAEKMKPEELRQLMETWQQGGISQETFLYQLKQGEILPAGRSVEEERQRIDIETGGGALPGGNNIIKMTQGVVPGQPAKPERGEDSAS
jgi:hypothetical protein